MLSNQTPKEDPHPHKGSIEGQNPQDINKENESINSEIKEGMTGHKRKQSRDMKAARVSNVSELPTIDSKPGADNESSSTMVFKAEILNINNVPSTSSSSMKDTHAKLVGFRKKSHQPQKTSLQLPAQAHYAESYNTNATTNEHHRPSANLHNTTHDTHLSKTVHPSVPEARRFTTESQIKSVEPRKPVNTEGDQYVVQSIGEFDDVVGLIGSNENAHRPTEKSILKPTTKVRMAEAADGLSQQSLYVRAAIKLPPSGPLAIGDFDNFLKKSKTDFDHFYHRKPISNLLITDFTLVKTLGIGAFGKVVLGEMKRDKTQYAIKIIDKVGVVKRNHVRYVSNEKRILQALNFPFVINMKYFFTDYYYLYFVMPFIPGGTFYKYLKTCKKISENEARFYVGQLVLALEYLHYLDLVHRDLKTENIMIDAYGYLKLVDFGQCVRCNNGDKTFTFTGTPDYMAPEIIVGKGYDCSVDWWALGVIAYEFCAGFRPFKNENARKLQLLILCNQYSIPSSFSRSLKKLIESLLVLEPKKRIANSNKKASMIKKHIWFKGLDWLRLLNRTLDAPYLPELGNKPSVVY